MATRDVRTAVYFAKIGPYVKIGWSRYAELRLKQLNKHGEVRLLAWFPGNHGTELAIHRALRHARVKGELFQEEAVRAYLKSLGFELSVAALLTIPARIERPKRNVSEETQAHVAQVARPKTSHPKRQWQKMTRKPFSMWDYVKERNRQHNRKAKAPH